MLSVLEIDKYDYNFLDIFKKYRFSIVSDYCVFKILMKAISRIEFMVRLPKMEYYYGKKFYLVAGTL